MTASSPTRESWPPRSAVHHVRVALPSETPLHDLLYMPFGAGRHPDTDAVGLSHLGWLDEHGMLDVRTARTFERARFFDLAGRIHHADDRETVQLVADFVGALFVLDDVLDGDDARACVDPGWARAAVERIARAAHGGRAPGRRQDVVDAVASGLADVSRRLARRGAPLQPYLAELDRSLLGLVEEARRRTLGYASVDDYAAVRTDISAVHACVELGLAAEGRVLPLELRPLARAANLSVCYVNDVYSWPKERAAGERSNLVRVLMDQHGLDERAAFHRACRLCDGVVLDYLTARDRLAARHLAALSTLQSFMRGNLDWHALGTARYAQRSLGTQQAA